MFSLSSAIREMSSPSFDRFLQQIESYYGRQVSSLAEMRARDNKKLKGDVWERFCQAYLQAQGRYQEVYLWNQIPEEIRKRCRLTSRVDNGIDLLAETKTGYIAIQCKYRGKINSTVCWRTLSTFIGICAATGPYEKHLVMTNCRGVTRKIPRGPKDRSICYGTFKNLSREMWLKMAGEWIEHRLTEIPENLSDFSEKEKKKLSPEELRHLRLKYFE